MGMQFAAAESPAVWCDAKVVRALLSSSGKCAAGRKLPVLSTAGHPKGQKALPTATARHTGLPGFLGHSPDAGRLSRPYCTVPAACSLKISPKAHTLSPWKPGRAARHGRHKLKARGPPAPPASHMLAPTWHAVADDDRISALPGLLRHP